MLKFATNDGSCRDEMNQMNGRIKKQEYWSNGTLVEIFGNVKIHFYAVFTNN